MKSLLVAVALVLQVACNGDGSTTSSSSGAQSGNGAGPSTGGTGGMGGSASTGGAGGMAGQGGGELCSEKMGGALIDFEIVAETLRLWITDNAFIDEAIAQQAGQMQPRVPVFEDLIDGQDCDPQWSWHVDPAKASFADATIELCDGLPSHIEGDKTYWLDTVGSYCPWSATVTAVDDRRQ